MGFEEFRSLTVDAIAAEVERGLSAPTLGMARASMRRIERMVVESEIAYEDGARLEDSYVRSRMRARYKDPTLELSWVEHPGEGFPR